VAAPALAPPQVLPVRDRASLNRFIRLPWRLYQDDPAWVPPLVSDVRKVLGPGHPFHEHSDLECFLAETDDGPVGRIAAVVNRTYNSFHETRTGFVGLFEAIDDVNVASALLETACAWLADRGMTEAIGPFNLSTNDELYSPGVLLDNFEHPPSLLMAHNPPYYARLFEAAGWHKERDLLSYWLEDDSIPDRLVRGVERLTGSIDGLVVRQIDLKRLDQELDRVKEVYNSAWEKNWGFAPLSEAEIAHLAREIKPIADARFALIAEVHGAPIGFALAVPDYNQALRHLNGRLWPFGILKLLWHRRKIDSLRVLTLGLKPEYQRRAVDALFYLRCFQNGLDAGYRTAEASWILEENWGMRRALERMGARVHKTYRVYGKSLV
jgi:GNAT superfamily N-acetyltransferase